MMKKIIFKYSFLLLLLAPIVSCNSAYDPEKALELMTLSDIAYESDAQVSLDYEKIKKDLEDAMKNTALTSKFELIWLGISEGNENLTFVVRDNSSDINDLAIVSRGTILSLLNIKEDLEVYELVRWKENTPSDIEISKGIHLALQTTLSLKSAVFHGKSSSEEKIGLSELISREVNNNSVTNLYVTGHSLGGAITTALGLSLSEEFLEEIKKFKLSVNAYNFAGQTIGNDYFKTYYESFINDPNTTINLFQVFNNHDTIPYAFNNLNGIKTIGYPYTTQALSEVDLLIGFLEKSLTLSDKKYKHVGEPIELKSALPPPVCDATVDSIEEFSCWASYEHQPFNYVDLLKGQANADSDR